MAILSKGTTFNNGDTVTSTGLNELVDQASFVSGVNNTTDDVTLEVHSGGYLKVKTIGSGNIASGAVTTDKISDGNVTRAKLFSSPGLSVIGRSASTTGVPSDITAGTDGHVLRRSGTSVGFGQIATAGITDAAVTPAKLSQPFTRGDSNTPGATSQILFAGIPSWVKRITLVLDGLSTNGSDDLLVQVGGSSAVTTGYIAGSSRVDFSAGTIDGQASTSGFVIKRANSANAYTGKMTVTNRTAEIWVAEGTFYDVGSGNKIITCAGEINLGVQLERIRIQATNNYDSGSATVFYE
jgi:hypothetical protein